MLEKNADLSRAFISFRFLSVSIFRQLRILLRSLRRSLGSAGRIGIQVHDLVPEILRCPLKLGEEASDLPRQGRKPARTEEDEHQYEKDENFTGANTSGEKRYGPVLHHPAVSGRERIPLSCSDARQIHHAPD